MTQEAEGRAGQEHMSSRPAPPAPGRRRPVLGPAVLLALGLGAGVLAYRLSLGQPNDPGPGLWPFIVCAVLTLTAAALFVLDRPGDYDPWTSRSTKILAGTLSLPVFIVAFAEGGVLVPTVLLLAFWLRAFGRENWRWTIAIAVVVGLSIQVTFGSLLGVPFPDGPAFLPAGLR